MTTMAERLAKAAKAGALQTLSEPRLPSPALPLLNKMRAYLADPSRWQQNRLYGRSEAEAEEIYSSLEQGFAVTPGCPACLLGTSFLATGNVEIGRATEVALFRALGFSTMSALIAWNDAPERTHTDVIARLDEAINKLEGRA